MTLINIDEFKSMTLLKSLINILKIYVYV